MSPLKICENVGPSFAGKGNPVLLTLAEKTSIRLKRRKILSKSGTISFAILLITTTTTTTTTFDQTVFSVKRKCLTLDDFNEKNCALSIQQLAGQ